MPVAAQPSLPARSTQLTLAVMLRLPQRDVLRIATDMAAGLQRTDMQTRSIEQAELQPLK